MKSLFETDSERFDRENPQVWKMFQESALGLIKIGVKHYGAKAIFETIRFHLLLHTTDTDFKLNNNHTPYYARKFHKTYPEHAGFFETRKAKVG